MVFYLTVLKMILEMMILIMEVIKLHSKGLHLLLVSPAAALKGLKSVLTLVYLQCNRVSRLLSTTLPPFFYF